MNVKPGKVITGPAGRAGELHVELGPGDPPAWRAGVAVWWLDCPGQTPFWSHYRLSVYHLRPLDGVEPARLLFPSATHELTLVAMAGVGDRAPAPFDPSTWQHLTPINMCEQVELPGDDAARELAELAARAVVAGVLPAEPALAGAVEPWRTALIKTSAHLRGEVHAP